ncbi:MAG: hypothetical protein H7237_12045 [Alkalinema sp. FL-bin-369]|nr:hypothetical protein [Leptolyngbyaceae cyanobacterium LF-bin-369]
MTIEKIDYEELLATYSLTTEAIALLRQHRPYLELMPSMRRPEDSLITVPLPIVRVRKLQANSNSSGFGNIYSSEPMQLPCEVAFLMCDPEWKVKTGREIFVFIHRPGEDLSEILGRWRQTQVILGKEYEWILPLRHQHLLTEGADKIYPLFVLSQDSPDRIRRGLKGAHLPCITQHVLSKEDVVDDLFPQPRSDSFSEVWSEPTAPIEPPEP